MANTIMYKPWDGTVVVSQNFLNLPNAAPRLAHEVAHVQQHQNNELSSPVGTDQGEYVDQAMRNEADAQVVDFEVRRELRDDGNNVPLGEGEQPYNDQYDYALETYRDINMSDDRAEALAREHARDELPILGRDADLYYWRTLPGLLWAGLGCRESRRGVRP